MKKFLLAVPALFLVFSAWAVDVNEKELKSAGGEDAIRFENYSGPHSVIETAAQISAIGTGLGKQVSASVNSSGTFGNGKYTVIHAVDPSESGKLDADIIIISSNATVDHIKNLRRIIGSYLSAAYGYSAKDAQTIATFVTVYNAVYRSKLDVYKSKYKNKVTANLTEAKCGLSTKWNEWAGNSQIVIPLGDIEGGLSTVDTSVISDKSVVQSMQEEDDKGVDERKNMVDIKEREAEAASDKAQDAARKAAEDKKAADEAKQAQQKAEENAAEKKEEARQAQQKAEEKAQEAKEDPSNREKAQEAKEAAEEARQAQKEAAAAEKEADRAEQKASEAESKASQSSSEAQKAQEAADKKASEAAEERREIAKDQQTIIEKALKEAQGGNSVIGLKITDASNHLSAMVRVDGETGETLKVSPVTVIRARTILPVKNAVLDQAAEAASDDAEKIDTKLLYMAICGENSGNGAVKLCLLDSYKMEIQKESNETVAEDSVLVEKDGAYYCVISDGGNNVLAKYDQNLKLLLKGSVKLNSATPVTITEKGIIVTDSSGKIVLLKLQDLSLVSNESSGNSSKAGFEK